MGKDWTQINDERNLQEARQKLLKAETRMDLEEWFRPVDRADKTGLNLTLEESRADPSERLRVEQKLLLAEALKNYEEAMQQDAGLAEIYRKAAEYAKTDATATYGRYEQEAALAIDIFQSLREYQEQLDREALTEEGDTYNFYERQVISANLFAYFERLRDGDLAVPPRKEGEKNIYRVDGIAHAPKGDAHRKDERLDDDAPLFTHEPNANDIRQGDLGDCYLLASLSSVASTHPEKIREAMHDDGNGKVTVRFYSRSKNDTYTPVFVTVDKVVPKGRSSSEDFAAGSLWVQIFERAWAASGLTEGQISHRFGRPVPEDIDARYEKFRKREEEGKEISRAERKANPWLFDADGNLHPWQPSYDAIGEGGETEYVVQSLLGPGYSAEVDDEAREFDDYVKNGKLDFKRLTRDGISAKFVSTWDVLHPGDPMNPQRAEKFAEETATNGQMEMRVLYEAAYDRAPLLDENGQISKADPNYRMIVDLMIATEDIFDDITIRSKKELESWYITNPQNTLLNKVREGLRKEGRVPGFNEDQIARRAINAKLRLVPGLFREQTFLSRNPQELDGTYNFQAVHMFDRIQAGAKAGIPMTCATRGDKVLPGLVDGHAYTLCDAYTKTIGGKEFRFVKVRNPWGSLSRSYEFRDGVLHGHEVDDTGGYAELELNDYLYCFSETHIPGLSAREKTWQELEQKLTKALAEHRDVEIQQRSAAGSNDQVKTFRLHSLKKVERDGIEQTMLRMLPEEPGGPMVLCSVRDYFRKYEHPKIGEINLERQEAVRNQEEGRKQILAEDRARAEAAEREFVREQEQAVENINEINRNPEQQARLDRVRAETELRLPYIHALGNLRNCFAKTEGNERNGSNEYYNMKNAVNQMIRVLERSDTNSRTDGMDAAAEAGRTARAYLRHCEEVSRFGARRKERVALAKKLLVVAARFESSDLTPQKTLADALKNNTLDAMVTQNLTAHPVPVTPEELRRHLAGMLVDKFADIAADMPDRKAESDRIRSSRSARESAIDSVLGSASFRSAYGGKDASALRKEIRQGEEAVYIRVAKEHNRLEKLAKSAPAKSAPERAGHTEHQL